MYEVSLSVAACVRSGTRAHVAWVVEDEGFGARDRGEALVVTPGGGRIGHLLGGAIDDELVLRIGDGTPARLLDVEVDAVGALIAGLPAGGRARCAVAPAADLPEALWSLLRAGEAVCLVAHRDGDRLTGFELRTADDVADAGQDAARLLAAGVTESIVTEDRVVTALWPVPRLALVGGNPLLDAVEVAAAPLGWRVHRFRSPADAAGLVMGFGPIDLVLVGVHDVDAAGSALQGALASEAGYIGALGSREVHERRIDWLVLRGVEGRERIHGPAGLDIGARRPAEVAIAVLAEAIAARRVRVD